VNVIRSKFATPDDALFVYTLLQSSTIANLMTTFTLVSTDYLKYLALTKSSNFDNRYQTTMDCYDLILNYISGAKDTMAADFKAQLKGMPCRNGFSLNKEISKWEEGFYPVYYDPIVEYKTTMQEFMNGLPSDFYEKPEEYAEGTAGYDGFPPIKNPSNSASDAYVEGTAGFDDSAPLKSAAEIVGYCNWNNCNGVVEGGDYCNQGKDACISCGSGSQWCDGPAIACADNYLPQDGDVGGWGHVAGAGGGQYVASCDECARWCTDRSACKSYECGGDLTELRCNLNEEANPSLQQYKNYAFCTKMSGTPALIKQLMG